MRSGSRLIACGMISKIVEASANMYILKRPFKKRDLSSPRRKGKFFRKFCREDQSDKRRLFESGITYLVLCFLMQETKVILCSKTITTNVCTISRKRARRGTSQMIITFQTMSPIPSYISSFSSSSSSASNKVRHDHVLFSSL